MSTIKLDLNALGKLYPDGWNDKSGKAAKFDSEDSEYRTYQPEAAKSNDGSIQLTVQEDHIRGGATDDHVELKVTYGPDGTMETVSMDWTAGSGGYQIPDWAITLTADAVAVSVDLIVDLLSEGAAIELDPEIAKVASKIVETVGKAYNFFSKTIVNWSDDGGRLNFIAVANHNLNKLVYCVRPETYKAPPTHVVYSSDAFEKAMGHHFNDKDDMAMEYESNDSNYRTWKLDDSPLYGGAGLYLSTKVDHIRGSHKDDHIIVMVGYNAAGKPIQGQAAVQMKNEDSIVTEVITQSSSGSVNIASAVANAVKSQLKKSYGESNSGRQNIPHIIEKNINAMNSSVAVKDNK
ncbi:MAG TPA: hypothetical protein VNA24_12285 [Hyalangium sp.]|nr:hypothetical protein [Hyalangium sp.]